MKSFIKGQFLIGALFASPSEWTYETNGADWPELAIEGNKCGGLN